MIIDSKLIMSDDQEVTVDAASTDVLDLGAAGDAVGNELYLVARVGTLFEGAGASLTIALQTAVAEGFGTPITLVSSPAIPVESLTSGATVFKVRLPTGAQRYLRGYYTITSGPFTAGKIDLFLTPSVEVR